MRKIYLEKRCMVICPPDEPALSDPNSVEFHVGDQNDISRLVDMFETSEALSRIFIPTDDEDSTYAAFRSCCLYDGMISGICLKGIRSRERI